MENKTPHLHDLLLGDGGYKSRKLAAFLFSVWFLFIGALMAGYWHSFSPLFAEYSGALVALFIAYLGGNVGGKWAIGKAVDDPTKPVAKLVADSKMAPENAKAPAVEPGPPGSAKVP